MEQRRVEEDGVALFQRKLHVVFLEVGGEFGPVEGEVAGVILLRMRQVQGGAGFDRHVTVGDGALQSQRRGEQVRMGRVARGLPAGHETEVVVAVGSLRGTARVDDVHLRCHLVVRSEPGLRDEGQEVVGVVVGKYVRSPNRELVQGSPDPVVGARFGEVIA